MAADPRELSEVETERSAGEAAFVAGEAGAVTVDWVVLSAVVIGLGMLVLEPVAFSASGSANGVSDYIENVQVGYSGN
jgi:hypothetical protein